MHRQRRDLLAEYQTDTRRIHAVVSNRQPALTTLSFERIAIPADISPASAALTADMIALAGHVRGQITVVMAGRSDDALEHQWLGRVRNMPGADAIPILCASVSNEPDDAILRYAREVRADLIGFPGTRQPFWKRAFLKSATRHIIAASRCPFWVGGPCPSLTGPPDCLCRNIICAVNLQSGSESLVAYADALARTTGTRLVVAYVMPDVDEGSLAVTLRDPEIVLSMDSAHAGLAALARSCSEPALPRISRGNTSRALMRLADALGPSLFVVGRRNGANIGSTALSLVQPFRHSTIIVPL